MVKLLISGLFVFILLFNTACDRESELNNDDTAKTEPELVFYETSNLSFYYPASVAEKIRSEKINASGEGAFIEYPEHKLLSFDDYLLTGTFLSPIIQVFPLDEYLVLSDHAKETIETLKIITAEKTITGNLTELPYLPWPNASQQFYANPEFIESETASGLRYLTQYVQDVGPVTNQGLFYTYQGITADQKYYISAVFPVNHAELPLDWDDYFTSSGTDYESFAENYSGYLDLTVQMLDESCADEFKPSLQLLDEIIKSLNNE